MQEEYEFRINEKDAKEHLHPTDGVCLSGFVRKVVALSSDPIVAKIKEIQRVFRASGEYFFLGWDVRRRYNNAELNSASTFLLKVKHVFEPCGEECGTLYDESHACNYCGSGSEQMSDLILDSCSLPKRGRLGIAKTIAREVVVSQGLVDLFLKNKLRGAEFRPVRKSNRSADVVQGWYQMLVNSAPLSIAASTRTCTELFDDLPKQSDEPDDYFDKLGWEGSWCDRNGQYICPLGHTIGLHLLSELSVEKAEYEFDIACTKQCIGVRRGLLRPERLLVVSQRFRQLAILHGLKGMDFGIARCEAR